MGEDGGPLKDQPKDQFRAQLKAVARVTGLLLSCAALFLSGFYLGIYQGELVQIPDPGIITGTYTPGASGERSTGESPVAVTSSTSSEGIQGTAAQGTVGQDSLAQESTAHAAIEPPLMGSGGQEAALPASAPTPTSEEVLANLRWPVAGKISSEPGWVEQKDLKQWVYYSGVEIACEPGSPVVAALAGRISKVEVDPILGTVVTVQHQAGLETTYGRVQGISKAPGDSVSVGDVIGSGGREGVYFSITSQGEPLSARQCLATAK